MLERPVLTYQFKARPWAHQGPAGWVFVSLPIKMSREIRKRMGEHEEGWGRLKASAQIGQTRWQTAIWFDTKANTYLLPLKVEIRKKAAIVTDELIHLTITL